MGGSTAPGSAVPAPGPLALPVVPPRTMTPPAAATPASPPSAPSARAQFGASSGPSPVLSDPPARPPEDALRAHSSVMAPLPVHGRSGRHELSSPGLLVSGRTDPSGVMAPLPSVVELPPPPEPRLRYRWVVYLVLVLVVGAVGLLIALTLSSKGAP